MTGRYLHLRVLAALLLVLIAAALGIAWKRSWSRDNTVAPPASTSTPEPDHLMDSEQREYLWQIEHHVLILNQKWFHELADQLARGDAAGLAANFPPDFQGRILDRPREDGARSSFGRVVRLQDTGSFIAASREDFVAYLLGWRQRFHSAPQVKVFPQSLAPIRWGALDSPWAGVGVLRLWGELTPGRPAEVVLRFDFQISRPRREAAQGWWQRCTVRHSQFAQSDKYLLADVTAARGIDTKLFHDNWTDAFKTPAPGGVYLCDFNRDGITDMLVSDVNRYFLFQGLPGRKFREVTSEMGLPPVPAPDPQFVFAAFADLDGDGWEDLLLGGQIYRNDGGKRFLDWTNRTNLRFPRSATGVTIVDFDKDGRIDLYVTVPGKGKARSWLDGNSGRAEGNQLWRNLGNWQFQDVTAASNTSGASRSVFSAVWLDADNNGWPDLYVPNEFGNGVLLVNRGDGTFREQPIASGPQDFGTMGITCGDINNDGYTDLYLANMYSKTGKRIVSNVKPGTYPEDIMSKMRRFVAGSQLYLNRGRFDFKPVAEEWQMNDVGWAYGPALIDLDNDGFLDVFATSGFMSFDRTEPDG